MGGNFAILNPCPKKWTDLDGEGRARFCGTCKTLVHSIADYSPAEWNRLRRESNGRVCGFLCGESTSPPRSRRALLVGALFTAIAPLWAQTGRIRIRVTDITGAAIPTATASLLGPDNKTLRTESADIAGEILWTDLPVGDSVIVVKATGFDSRRLTVTSRNNKELLVEARLEVGSMGTVVTLAPEPAPVPPSLASAPAPAVSQTASPASPQPRRKHRWWKILF